MKNPCDEPKHHDHLCCPEIPELRRLRYFYGQHLGSQDFLDEQNFFREKIKLLNRCMHGYGVVCGLEVVPEPFEEPCEPERDRERERYEEELKDILRERRRLRRELKKAETEEEKAEIEAKLEELAKHEEEVRRQIDEICPPSDRGPGPRGTVVMNCGFALDCLGNEIILRHPHTVDLWKALSPADQRWIEEHQEGTVYLSVCYCELPVEPVRPVAADTCSPPAACAYAKIQDSYRIVVSLEPPPEDTRCETCCCSCCEPCLLLARIDHFAPGVPVEAEDIHTEVRREISKYTLTTMTGISWVHGGEYTDDQAAKLFGRKGSNNGLEFRFSRPVLTETLRAGVAEIMVVEGGAGRSASIYHVAGEIVDLPTTPTTDRLRYRQSSDDKFHEGDRVMIRLRADFVLDECCRAVDGNHIGGRLPLLEDYADREHPEVAIESCIDPPLKTGPWETGDGQAGGLFESWIFIK